MDDEEVFGLVDDEDREFFAVLGHGVVSIDDLAVSFSGFEGNRLSFAHGPNNFVASVATMFQCRPDDPDWFHKQIVSNKTTLCQTKPGKYWLNVYLMAAIRSFINERGRYVGNLLNSGQIEHGGHEHCARSEDFNLEEAATNLQSSWANARTSSACITPRLSQPGANTRNDCEAM